MSTIDVSLREEAAAWIERHAKKRGLSPNALLAEIAEEHVAKNPDPPRSAWGSGGRSDRLLHGQNCALCDCLRAAEGNAPGGFAVCELKISRLVFMRNQFVRGYCVLICHEHVKEPYSLAPHNQAAFFDDLMRVGCALDELYHPEKMNFEILGNRIPHLHCHVKPRYRGDDAGGRPIDQDSGEVILTAAEYDHQLSLIRGAILER